MADEIDRWLDRWNVSRETRTRIDVFVDLLFDWQQRINLISVDKQLSGNEFIDMVWYRHIIDSLQSIQFLPNKTIVDLGSGGGFPGLLLSIASDRQVHLVESDIRKCEFLKEAARVTHSDVIIHNKRIEQMDKFPEDICITSRACASVLKILELSKGFNHKAEFLLLKGQKANMEIEDAKKNWHIDCRFFPSVTNTQSSIIHISGAYQHGQK